MKIYKYFFLSLVSLSISVALSAQGKNLFYSKGYKANVQAGYIFEGKEPTYTATTSHGYCFGNGLYVGGGTGLYFNTIDYGYETRTMIPVFGEVKYSLFNWKVNPFVDLKAGMIGDCTMKGFGYVLAQTVGIDFPKISVEVGTQRMKCNYDSENMALGNTGVFVGLSFNF